MRDVEEVMVGFQSTVESCQEYGTLALRAVAVLNPSSSMRNFGRFFWRVHVFHLTTSAPSAAKYAMSS